MAPIDNFIYERGFYKKKLITRYIPLIAPLRHNWTSTFKLLESAFKKHLGENSEKHITAKKNLFPDESCNTGNCKPPLYSAQFKTSFENWRKILEDDSYAPHRSKHMD
jgi:hypothetical protein